MSLILKAAQFAKHAHDGQLRKYTNRPYIEHPMRVAGQVAMIESATEEMVAAAWLHDVVEDCAPEHKNAIKLLFPLSVQLLVLELTNPSKGFSELPRAERKAMDRQHLAQVSREAKIIKLIDRIDNLQDMTLAPADFQHLYAYESRLLAKALRSDDPILRWLTNSVCIAVPYMRAI